MLEQMTAMEPESAEFEAALDELIKAVNHHVEEEESRVLPGIQQRLSEARRAELAEAFVTARTEHLGERPGQATRDDLGATTQKRWAQRYERQLKEEIKEDLLAHAQQSGE